MYTIKDIPVGCENAISRSDLAKLWNCNDRTARRVLDGIEAGRAAG